MCYLTATKQAMMTPAGHKEILDQVGHVLNHYKDQEPARYVNFNWMARGEPLDNPDILNEWLHLSYSLSAMAEMFGVIPRFNISTILPRTLKKPLDEVFQGINPTIYYSLYSLNPYFRHKWLPAAMPVDQAVQYLRDWQHSTKKMIKLHWAIIKGENDNDDYSELQELFLGVKFAVNIVRYNPFSEEYGQEADDVELKKNQIMAETQASDVQVVPRVGQDVAASCGMFVQ